MFVVATTRRNASPSLILELLSRVARVVKDYCGALTEDALRKNAILVYELLDEMLDHGYTQSTNTDSLKHRVHNEPAAVAPRASRDVEKTRRANVSNVANPIAATVFAGVSAAMSTSGARAGAVRVTGAGTANARVAADAAARSVLAPRDGESDRDEIFVDVVEKVNVVFGADGTVAAQDVDGTIRVRNFLHGDPSIRVALSEDLVIGGSAFGGGGGGAGGDYATCFLDDANFHECADTSAFDAERVLRADVVPRGEFALMNYRSSADFPPPFRVATHFDESAPYQVVATITIEAAFSETLACAGLAVTFPTPKSKSVVAATTAIDTRAPPGSQHAAHGAADRAVLWQLKRVKGGETHTLRVSMSTREPRVPNIKKECGPVSLSFVVPSLNASRLKVRYLTVDGKADPSRGAARRKPGGGAHSGPHRWVRYVTKSNNFVARV
jgi:AP-4 complex subunit mu-1